jgi:phospholipase/carboxylesterase
MPMNDPIQNALVSLLPPLLGILSALEAIGRHLHPPLQPALIDRLGDQDKHLHAAVSAFEAVDWPEPMHPFRDRMALACLQTLRAADGLRAAPGEANPLFAASRALRQTGRALEALYPVARMLPSVSRFFLEPGREDLVAGSAEGTGVLHAGNDPGMRGGFSVYVPEWIDRSVPVPVVFALHGGSGHGRLFLWNWVREARSLGFIVVAPTARGDTWSLHEPGVDSENLAGVLVELGQHYALDPKRRLLTGMSDGGTFTLLSGLDADSPFTHLAPVAASFHPMMIAITEPERMRGLPVYLVHGALDWMFPVSVGRMAAGSLKAAGAAVVYREVGDLSHTYPRDENGGILEWFLG